MSKSISTETQLGKKDDSILNAESVVNTFQLLKKAIDEPGTAPPSLVAACRSQGALASLVLPEFKICAMSLNTMKTHADQNGKILWSQLDDYRKVALKKHQKLERTSNKATRGSRTYLENRLAGVERELQQKINEIINYVDRYDDLLTLSRDNARLSATFEAKLKRHLDRYLYMDRRSGRSNLRIIAGGKND